jgi:vacuolar-type H+-ATPase subunit E/Vma4
MTSAVRLPGAPRAVTALAPARGYLVGQAEAEADRMLAAARAEADAIVRQARDDATRAVGQARAQGRADAAPLAAAERSRGRARARAIVLGAQREAYDELSRRIHAEADGLRAEPGYPRLLTGLSALAARTAGPGARISYPPAGGVLARSGQAVVDCSLPRLAAQAVLALGDQARELWEQ